ncbi:MAG: DNA polymerase III subunit epsilon [Methylophilaceae bacterium]|jgi:DNA polymerase-3 subunit epsilon|nr:DNA polymerase III subunit epsilon [Methylophilaceae bacterium]NBQ84894.1 DNA polymerase III subunit epsilon [Methylophilaceae bacterium]
MRQVFLDTETTGLYPAQGHRIIEIAAVEAINRRVTNNHFHVYLNPEREIDEAAQEVHGITLEFLQDKPKFEEVVRELLDFVADSELIIHNAPFDVGFLNAELGRIERENIEHSVANIIDTLKMAKDMRPGQRNNLDALCRHFGIDNSKRTLHGALLDAELLAEVYMAMTRGQESLMIDMLEEVAIQEDVSLDGQTRDLKVLFASADEISAHDEYLKALNKGDNIWQKFGAK